jgi:cytochrome c biogenesis protein CcmG/thiol:disulfide interchange protein DsbE
MTTLTRRRALMLAPLAGAAVIGVAFWEMLARMSAGKFDPHAIDNPLVGKPLPGFSLPGIGDRPGFATADLRAAAAARPVLVNFFWSQCIPCMQEADTLGAIAAEGIPLWGIAVKDKPDSLTKFLNRFGNPFTRIADDRAGLVSIDWGVDGYPESFLIDRAGIVRWHLGGPLTDDNIRNDFRPALQAIA